MVMESKISSMERATKVNGLRITCKGMVDVNIRMELYMLESFLMIKDTAMVFTNGQMDASILVGGIRDDSMVLANTLI